MRFASFTVATHSPIFWQALLYLLQSGTTFVLALLIGPSDYGQLAGFMAAVALLMPLLHLNLPYILAHHISEGVEVAQVVDYWLLSVSLVFFLPNLVVVIVASLEFYWLLLTPALLFQSLILVRQQLFYLASPTSALFYARAECIFAALMQCSRLVIGVIAGSIAALISFTTLLPFPLLIYLFFAPRNSGSAPDSLHNGAQQNSNGRKFAKLSAATSLIGRYSSFTFWQTIQQLLNQLSMQAPVLLLLMYKTAADAGLFGLAFGLAALPALFLTKASSDWFYAQFCVLLEQPSQAWTLFYSYTARLAAVSIALYTLMSVVILTEALTPFIPQRWQDVQELMLWIFVWQAVVACNGPALRVIMALQRQRLSMLLNLFSTAIRLAILFWLLLQNANLHTLALVYSSFGVLHNLLFIGLAGYLLRKNKTVIRSSSIDI